MEKLGELKYKTMRGELLEYVDGLSDINHQQECWVKQICPPSIQEDFFGLAIHFFYDDTDLNENPQSWIGWILYDESEVEAIRKLTFSIDIIFEIYGTVLSDEEYIGKPEWSFVLEAATHAKAVLSAHDQENAQH